MPVIAGYFQVVRICVYISGTERQCHTYKHSPGPKDELIRCFVVIGQGPCFSHILAMFLVVTQEVMQ